MNGVQVFVFGNKFGILKKTVGKSAQRALKALNKNNSLVEIYLISSRQMRFLNRRFRGKNKATSVLSFNEPKNFPHPESRLRPLGEIYLNATRITRGSPKKDQRALRGSLADQRESAYLLVHGLLHLLGYEHKKKRDRIRMEKKEKKILYELRN